MLPPDVLQTYPATALQRASEKLAATTLTAEQREALHAEVYIAGLLHRFVSQTLTEADNGFIASAAHLQRSFKLFENSLVG